MEHCIAIYLAKYYKDSLDFIIYNICFYKTNIVK